MKPVISVAFAPDAPVESFLSVYGECIELTQGPTWIVNCSEVRETTWGFLQLVPKEANGRLPEGAAESPVSIYVPPHYILWMAQAEQERQLGFLPAKPKAVR